MSRRQGVPSHLTEAPTTLRQRLALAPRWNTSRSTTLPLRVALGSAIALALEGVGVGVRYLVQVLLARLAGANEYGHFSLGYSGAQLLMVPAGLGLTAAAAKLVPRYLVLRDWDHLRGFIHRSYRATAAAGTVLALVATAFILILGNRTPADGNLLLGFALAPSLALFALQGEMTRATGHFVLSQVLPNLVQPILLGTLALAVAVLAGDVAGPQLLFALAASLLFCLVAQHRLLRMALPCMPRNGGRSFSTRSWLRLATPLLGVRSFQVLLNQADVVIVGIMLGSSSAGIYAAANRTAALVSLVLAATTIVTGPLIARSHAELDEAAQQGAIRVGAKLAFWPTLVVSLLLLAAADPLMAIFGPDFRGGATPLRILAVGQLVNGLTGPVGAALNMTGHERTSALVYGVAAGMGVLLTALGVRVAGVVGAAAAMSLAMIGANLALFLLVPKKLSVRPWPLPLRP